MDFDSFARSRLPGLLRFATALTAGDPHLAEDLVQEALARASVRWSRVEAADRPELYVKRIITNQYISLVRRKSFRAIVLRCDIEETIRTSIDSLADEIADRDELRSAMARLPHKQRAAMIQILDGLDFPTVVQSTTVDAGRAAIEVRLVSKAKTQYFPAQWISFYFDPDTGVLLEKRTNDTVTRFRKIEVVSKVPQYVIDRAD